MNAPRSILLLSLFTFTACGGTTTDGEKDAGPSDTSNPTDTQAGASDPVDYRTPGPYGVTSEEQSYTVSASCDMDITLYSPLGASNAPLVILSHGFARGPSNMSGWAEHFASWGVPVATPKLCHASPFDSDHAANGVELTVLREQLGASEVIYAGHSAGGLAAVLAGAQDPNTLGVIGLDVTDADNLAMQQAGTLSAPLFGIAGEPSSCNSSGNATGIYNRATDGVGFRVTEADHCDFESPTDGLCTAFCNGSNDQFSDAEIQSALLGLLTAAVIEAADLDDGAVHWWNNGGSFYDELTTSGIISPL